MRAPAMAAISYGAMPTLDTDRRLDRADLPRPLPGLRYELAGEEVCSELAAFLNRVFDLQREERDCQWKYFSHGISEPNVGLVREEATNAIVAVHPFLYRRAWVEGQERVLCQIADVAIQPEFRRGIQLYKSFVSWTQLDSVLRGFPFGYGGAISAANRKIGKRLVGYDDLLQLDSFERRLSLRRAVERRAGQTAARLADIVTRPLQSWRFSEADTDIEIESLECFDSRFDRLWARYRDRYRVILTRDHATLRWRFDENPKSEFVRLAAVRGRELAGYAVLRLWDQADTRMATILDLFDGREPTITARLLQACTLAAMRLDRDFLRFAPSPGSPAAQLVSEREGWRRADEPSDHVIYKTLAPDPEAYGLNAAHECLSHGENWYYCQADSDFLE